MTHLFAYGTLMCDDIMAEASGLQVAGAPAELKGFCRLRVKEECYPALLPREGGTVDGVIYRDIPDPAWQRLDRFEGPMYSRQNVIVEMPDGTALPAATYVALDDFRDQFEEREWDFTTFLRSDKEDFLVSCRS